MAQICIFSRHIPKQVTDADEISRDIREFNRAVRRAFSMDRKDPGALKPSRETGKPDMRRKENRAAAALLPESVHVRLKKEFGMNDYFANSAHQEAKGVLRSVMELRGASIREKERILKEVSGKLEGARKRLGEMEKTKGCCIALSRYEKSGTGRPPKLRMPKGGAETWDKETGVFYTWRYDPAAHERVCTGTYENRYLFEVRFLDPRIRALKARVRSLEGRVRKLSAAIRKLGGPPAVCFGGKDLFRKQGTVYKNAHGVWRAVFRRKRASGMTISGRKDSKDGNFVFRYDPGGKTLSYTSISGKRVIIPGVEFPYGQGLLEGYLAAQGSERTAPVAWRIEDHGGSWVVKAVFSPVPGRINDHYGDGCVGMDTNVGLLSISETDRHGNLLRHKDIHYSLEGLSSGQAEAVLSAALEEAFRWCIEKKKPFAMEKLHDVTRGSLSVYGSRKRNRALSGFAHAKAAELARSKGRKYGIAVEEAAPAYTSQIGKAKYMSRYGLSVHGAASLVIARRAQGFKEKLPALWRAALPEDKRRRHHWAHWAHYMKYLGKHRPGEFYRSGGAPADILMA